MTHRPRPRGTALLALAATIALAACTGTPTSEPPPTDPAVDGEADLTATGASAGTEETVFDASTLHSFSLELDDAEYAAMIDTYVSSGDKEWITATVTIDGETFENVGAKLKGNSSLRGATADTDPVTLPWRIRLDKYVDSQQLDGYTDFVVRANNSQTSLNEAVALDLLEAAGLASEHAVASTFTVNGSESELRLVVQNLDDTWDEENFSSEGILYKADAEGDYSYRGDDPTAYTEAFDVEAGEEDYAPLVEFLDFVNNSSDEDFAADLDEYVDVESFARYLAFEDLVGNFDDIAGPGNNSFLRWDADTGVMTVVAWDHNLAFGGQMGDDRGGRAGGGQFPGGQFPEGMTPPENPGELPEGMTPPDDQQDGFPGGRPGDMGGMGGNILAERFEANADFAALYGDALADLQAELVDSGVAQQVLDGWVDVLTHHASDLVEADTVTSEAEQISAVLSGETTPQQTPSRRFEGNTDQSSTTSDGARSA
ncbi:CotH kinase family protein [Ornithinimicrobium sp. F0845]|uniref:CotH kinase family protein n=1 Tax=Ornithinimicrobium sp. F0845 TaxID=2926412 RepID=UPI001FF50CB8|nr:CotH kinase family protein [Ornithinimicrobium sp. F0845]MCK0110689.1 CotH kinase family protein [Ornithinimicrobium sp. F0845]